MNRFTSHTMNNWPLGNEPPVHYSPPSPTESSDDEEDLEARYLPCMDMMLAARSSKRDAMKLAEREQRRKEAYMRENPRIEEVQPSGEEGQAADSNQQGEEETQSEGETQPVERTTCFFFKQYDATMEDVEKRMRGMSGAYPRSPPSGGEGGPPMEEIPKKPVATVGNASGEGKARVTRSKRSRPPQPPRTNPGILRSRQSPPPSKKKKTPPQPLQSYQELLARRNKELALLDARIEKEREALQDRREERLEQAARGTQPFERDQELRARRNRELAVLDDCRERRRDAVEDKWEERLEMAAKRFNGGMQPTVENVDDVDEEGDSPVERKNAGEARGFGYPTLNPELFRPVRWTTSATSKKREADLQPTVENVDDEGKPFVEGKTVGSPRYPTLNPELSSPIRWTSSASSKKRKAELQPTVEEIEDEGDPYVDSKQAVPPRRPAHPILESNFLRQRRSPSPVRPRNAGPRDVDSLLDRRSLWHDYYMSLDRASEKRAKEALRRAGVTETNAGRRKRARHGTTDVECRRVDMEHRRTGTEHRQTYTRQKQTDPDSKDWFKYFEDIYDSDTMEYQHRLEEAKRYGIPISPPAVASDRKKESKPTSPAAKRQKHNAPEREPYPCFSKENVLKPLSSISRLSGGRWSTEEEMRREMRDKEVKATVVETMFTHKPEVVETTFAPTPPTAQNLPQNTPFKPKVVETTPTHKPATVQTTPTPTPPIAQNPPRQVTAQTHPQPFLTKTRSPRTHTRKRSN